MLTFIATAAAPATSVYANTADATAVAVAPAQAVGADPNIDRGFLLPTAMTQPAGSLTYNNYELVLHGLTYGISDNVQLSATALSPITRDMPFFGTAALKLHQAAGERLHLALQTSASYGHVFGESADLVTLGAGGLASFCLRADCSSLLTAAATYQLLVDASGDPGSAGTAHLLIYGASVVHRVGRHVKLLGEVTSATVRGPDDHFDNAPGVLVSYGVRFHGDSLAGDIGFMKPLSTEGEVNDALLLGLPFISVSYRW
jgi:hypothetical protein